MALRNQPYLPLYVQDFLTDEKLNMCSASTQGVYIKIMCIMHKSDDYGVIKLKAKYKQNESIIDDFANLLLRLLPFSYDVLRDALTDLIDEGVLYIEEDKLCQRRMIKDGAISEKRASAGSAGGKKGRNSGTKRFYNEEGYLYLIYDKNDAEAFKIGISKEPEKRILGIIRKSNRPGLQFRRRWLVSDMGASEQEVLDYFDDIRDGEWIFGSYKIEEIENQIESLIKSKTKAKHENEDEYENEYINEVEYVDVSKLNKVSPNKKKSLEPSEASQRFIDWYLKTFDTKGIKWTESALNKARLSFDKSIKRLREMEGNEQLSDEALHGLIAKVIEFVKADNFWTTVFISPSKLIEKDKAGIMYLDRFVAMYRAKSPEIRQQRIIEDVGKSVGQFIIDRDKREQARQESMY